MAVALIQALEKVLTPYRDWRFKLIKEWNACVGPLQAHIRLERIDQTVVIIGVYDVHWMQELYLLSQTIIERINQQLGANHVSQVRFQLIEQRPFERRFLTPRTRALKPANSVFSQKQQEALKHIKDPQLKDALYDFFMKSQKVHE